MRIISGKFKGKSIKFIKSINTRPLKDSVRENIFNIINHSNLLNIEIKNSSVLDLYSGTGSFGLECISRDANHITFVEKDTTAKDTLSQNLSNLFSENKASIVNEKIYDFLIKKQLKKFDIFFLDPPFAENDFIDDLKIIKQKKIYKKKHLVIVHREKKSPDDFNNGLKPIIIKTYGRSKIIFGVFN